MPLFLDTNILLDSISRNPAESRKRDRAVALLAPRKDGLPKPLRNCKILTVKGEQLAMTKCGAEVQLTTGDSGYSVGLLLSSHK